MYLSPRSQLDSHSACHEIYGTTQFITVFTIVRHWTPSSATLNQSSILAPPLPFFECTFQHFHDPDTYDRASRSVYRLDLPLF